MDYCIKQQHRKEKYIKDAQNHVPLDCTDNYWVYFKATSLVLPLKIISRQSLMRLCVVCSMRGKGVFESSTVILTFPLISSIVPILSRLSIFMSTVQCQLTRYSESARGRGRSTGYGRNEGRWRPHRQGSYQSRRGLCQDATGHMWV